MAENILSKWLRDRNNNRIAPKTYLSQVLLPDGKPLTALSQLSNDTNFQNLSDVESKIKKEISSISSLRYEIVSSIPTAGEVGVIYLIKDTDSPNNEYKEYIWVGGKAECLGSVGNINVDKYVDKDTFVAEISKMQSQIDDVQGEIENIHSDSWYVVSHNLKHNKRESMYPIGKQFVETHSEYGDISWEINDYDNVRVADGNKNQKFTMEMVKCINGLMMDNYEFMHVVEGAEMSPGSYHFFATKPYEESESKPCGGNKSYTFTLSSPIPVGGGIRLNWGYGKDIVTAKVETFKDAKVKDRIETTTLSLGADGIDLGRTDGLSLNHIDRMHFGSNNIAQSGLLQYLNGIGTDWWSPQTKWDTAPPYVDKEGFLGGFPEDFINSIVPTKHVIATNRIVEEGYDVSSSYEITCKVFPMSMAQVGFGNNDKIAEEAVLDKYKNTSNVDRVKVDNSGIARYWWLCSPNPWLSYYVRGVSPSGQLSSSYACNGFAVVAACTIQ